MELRSVSSSLRFGQDCDAVSHSFTPESHRTPQIIRFAFIRVIYPDTPLCFVYGMETFVVIVARAKPSPQ
jgi:hypothetical protein